LKVIKRQGELRLKVSWSGGFPPNVQGLEIGA
jgi:hypothetical protein